ncbi:MAG TPA: CheR family methyltransferase [Mycobacteriales bacterium]|nr:CheR family methyltransferase [Mycobacteriales bacterium]
MPDEQDEPFERLLDYLRDSRGSDFTGYKRPSLHRLVDRKMRATGIDDYDAYRDLLEVQPAEANALLDALLINVTAFFRDPDAWQQLREELLPAALASIGPDEPVRVWSAACASGEEAYTLAIVLHELLGDEAYRRRVKIYATDIDDAALATARAGTYSATAVEPVGPDRIATYFEREGERYRFRSDLRPSLIFGRHDLLNDAPISRILLLACRNALMYFTSESQTRVLERFSFALHPSGLLLLGKAEMLLTQSQLFVPVSLQQRIFSARRTASGSRLAALAMGGRGGDRERRRFTDAAFHAAPAAQIVLDQRGTLLLVNERAQRDLPLSRNDVGSAFSELQPAWQPAELRGTIAAVQAGREVVELRDVDGLPNGGTPTRWDIRVAPLQEDAELLGVHIVFSDVTERYELRERLDQVHHELSTAYEELQSSGEELETTNEELQSAVEELETTNEELQSTNEELETMNEELQSTNEELQTLNDELRERTNEVDQSNGFLQSIVEGLEMAVVVVDADARVQLWNTGAERLTGIRSFEAEGLHLLDLGLDLPADEVRGVLRDIVVLGQQRAELEATIVNRFGRRHQRRMLAHPLRRRQGDVHGAVLTLVDQSVTD